MVLINGKAKHVLHLVTLCLVVLLPHMHAEWLNHGGGIANRRSAMRGDVLINPKTTVKKLRLRWKFITGSDVTATPSVADGVAYFPSWNGNLYAVNATDGNLIWQQNIGNLTGLSGNDVIVNVSVSRSTPAVTRDLLLVGIYGPAYVIAVNRTNGELVWSTQIDPLPLAQITNSGTVYGDAFYVGVSSLEQLLPPELCCTFRGRLVKLDVETGAVLWQTFTLPDNGGRLGGFSGGAIWGSSPSIDVKRGLVLVGTGNLYNASEEVLKCQAEQNNQTQPTGPDRCFGDDVHFDSMLALDLESGDIIWSRKLDSYDILYYVCLFPNNYDQCPPGPNLDGEFGEAPMLLTIKSNGRRSDIAVALQKSGFAWALDRDNGEVVWFRRAGPGSYEGGGIWGAATDGKRVYTNIMNGNRITFNLAPSSLTTNAGAWVALDARDGEILWSTANPSNETSPGPVTIVNGVLFAGSVAPNGPFYGMNAKTGTIIWTKYTGASVYGGASASYGCVFIGNGISLTLARLHPTWTRGNSVSAYCVH